MEHHHDPQIVRCNIMITITNRMVDEAPSEIQPHKLAQNESLI